MLAEIGNITTVQQTTVNSKFPSYVPNLDAMTGNCIFQGIRYLHRDVHCKHSGQIPPPLICGFIVHVFLRNKALSRPYAYRMESDTRLLCNQPVTYILQAFRRYSSMNFLQISDYEPSKRPSVFKQSVSHIEVVKMRDNSLAKKYTREERTR